MNKILLFTLLIFNAPVVFAGEIADVIAGKSYEHLGGDNVTYINSFNQDCTVMSTFEDGFRGKDVPIKCGETVVIEQDGKTVTFLLEGTRVSKEVDLGFKDIQFYPKEVPNPK